MTITFGFGRSETSTNSVENVQRQLSNEKNESLLSPISIREARHLVDRRKLRLDSTFSEWLRRSLDEAPVKEVPINFAVAEQAAQITLPHADPGDVFLAATARVYDLILVTADTQPIGCKWLKTVELN